MLNIKSLTINYGKRTILKSVNAEFKRGTITVIKGESGSGKSSLLNVLGLMQAASNYEYTFDNTVVSNFNDKERADFRLHNIGFVFQQSNLIQELTAKENLIVPMSIAGKNTDIEKKAHELIRYVGLEKVWNDYPGSLSGGEEQRLAVARAIANDADIILADEPTASLDAANSSKVLDLFSKLAHELNKIVIVVSHNESVEKYADVIYEIKDENLVVTKSLAVRVKPDISSVQTKPSQKRSLMRFVRYYTKKRRGDRVLNRVFIAVTAVVATIAILTTSFGANITSQQEAIINSISDKSIFIVNDTLNRASHVDYEEAFPIASEIIAQIETIPGVSKVYPWYSFTSNPWVTINKGQATIKITEDVTPKIKANRI